jgi:hypothetical protein
VTDESGDQGDDVLGSGGDLEEQGNYPLCFVPDTIEPGVMMFTLWGRPADQDPVCYDFGFDWDGETSAIWNCDGPYSGAGTADWSNGTDLELNFDPSSTQPSSTTTLADAAPSEPMRRSEWVEMARQIVDALRQAESH